ncbi:unnamed protein product, partial [Timema podura]|nr:unnamed protein product [Timema podura]
AIYGSNSIPVLIREIENDISVLEQTELEEDGPNSSIREPYREVYTTSQLSNQLTFWSTVPGFASFRHPIKGTWFIEALHNEMLQQEPGMDIFSIFTRVNNKISSRRHKPMNGQMWKGMTPVFQVALTKKLLLPLHPAAQVATAKKIICRFLFYQLYDEYVRRNITILAEQRRDDP